jgi:hypothetical protein
MYFLRSLNIGKIGFILNKRMIEVKLEHSRQRLILFFLIHQLRESCHKQKSK